MPFSPFEDPLDRRSDSFTSTVNPTFRSPRLSTSSNVPLAPSPADVSPAAPVTPAEPAEPAKPAEPAEPAPAAPAPPSAFSAVTADEGGDEHPGTATNDPDADPNLGAGVNDEFGFMDFVINALGFPTNVLFMALSPLETSPTLVGMISDSLSSGPTSVENYASLLRATNRSSEAAPL